MHKKILLAGASGQLGRAILEELKAQGFWVRTLSQHPGRASALKALADEVWAADLTRPTQLKGVAQGIDLIISCAGGSVSPGNFERRSYSVLDYQGHLHLLSEARNAKVTRFIYTSLWLEAGYLQNGYVQAHEKFVQVLRESGLSYLILRPTGLFSAMQEFFEMARRGMAMVPGSGQVKTNPIHQQDVAKILMDYLFEGPEELGLGGPEIMSRQDIFTVAFQVLGKKPRYLHVPPGVLKFNGSLLRPFSPRHAELMAFFAEVSTTEAIAPQWGKSHLADYFQSLIA